MKGGGRMPFSNEPTQEEVRTMHLDGESRIDLGRERMSAYQGAAEADRSIRSAEGQRPGREPAQIKRRIRRLAPARLQAPEA
jgi:hypothetical protein